MGTNYNLISTDKTWVVKYFGEKYADEWRLVDTPFFGYAIHIGKRSDGWKPLFQTHNRAYRSVAGMMEFLRREEGRYRIYDEYNKELSIEELKVELVEWGKNQRPRRLRYEEGMLLEDPDGEITTPVDHLEYARLDAKRAGRKQHYWKDKEGHNFKDGYFC